MLELTRDKSFKKQEKEKNMKKNEKWGEKTNLEATGT
jgi:predicted nucleic acid-binding protein